jgi:hypothetical protein
VTDVFVSYAREDRDRAHKLANALAAFGWSVWWDRKIITGESVRVYVPLLEFNHVAAE